MKLKLTILITVLAVTAAISACSKSDAFPEKQETISTGPVTKPADVESSDGTAPDASGKNNAADEISGTDNSDKKANPDDTNNSAQDNPGGKSVTEADTGTDSGSASKKPADAKDHSGTAAAIETNSADKTAPTSSATRETVSEHKSPEAETETAAESQSPTQHESAADIPGSLPAETIYVPDNNNDMGCIDDGLTW